jgi:hypothetical protein
MAAVCGVWASKGLKKQLVDGGAMVIVQGCEYLIK